MLNSERFSERPFVATLTGVAATNGLVRWYIGREGLFSREDEEGLQILFPLGSEVKPRHATRRVREILMNNSVAWLREVGGEWVVDLDELYLLFTDLDHHAWLKGKVRPTLEIEVEEAMSFGEARKESIVRYLITKSEIEASMSKRIFLSHKGIDKPIVRDYFKILKTIGFEPWLDEDAMVAGVPLERGLLSGMRESCAAVFFVTPEYRDENFLASEIDYAMARKREMGERFSIITLVLTDPCGTKGSVPELLKQFVWKEPENVLQGLNEILRALPIHAVRVEWKG